MKRRAFSRISKIVVTTAVILAVPLARGVSAAPAVKDGAKCTKVGAKIAAGKNIVFVCTKYGTKTSVLKWKKTVIKTTTTTTTAAPMVIVTTTTAPSMSTANQIVIEGYAFKVSTGIKSTDAVTIINKDSFSHTVTSGSGESNTVSGYAVKSLHLGLTSVADSFDISVSGNSSKTLPSLKAGTYNFHCKIHTSMQGTIIIG